ncbi:hypothetical protein ABZV58_27640 [Nocardia sp. NPDC004654]|uniref:hypothetical protein n=1 Tax=Nocardia sp. NPDC004654 TaxID=3154776 RepID=UPI0033B15726
MTQDPKQEALARLAQEGMRAQLASAGDGAWTTIYQSWHDSRDSNGGIHCALVDPQKRDKALSGSGWDVSKTEGAPGFSISYPDGEELTTYHRSTADDGFEPLVILRQFHGVVPDEYHFSEEFILLMNLWRNPETGNYEEVERDIRVEAIQIERDHIRVRTPILRRYQAARQMDLALYLDSVIYVADFSEPDDFISLREKDHIVNGDTVVSLGIGDVSSRVFSRLLATRILPPPPQAECGIWPWEADEEYPEFIIGETSTGKRLTYTCDPDELANYFGANPDAPHYLTPVSFRKEVLQRYYDDPIYRISDGYLACGTLWGVQIDNHGVEVVNVFLGDVGRDIPVNHRDHWKAHNIVPIAGLSETTIRRSFFNQPTNSPNLEHIFKQSYLRLAETWNDVYGGALFREPKGSDAHALSRLRIPLNDSDAEFEAQLLLLCKLMVDLLNEKEVAKGLDKVPDEKGISKLNRRLASIGYSEVERDIAFMRRLQEMRSKVSAHSKGSDFDRYLKAQLGTGTKPDLIAELMKDAIAMADGIAAHISQL